MPRRVLVVDDEEGIRDMMRFTLGPFGFAVDAVADGEAAVAAVTGRPYDLVILDLNMPVMSGRETLRRLREVRPRQPVLMISSGGGESAPEGAPAEGLEWLYKPMCQDDLLAAVERLARPAGATIQTRGGLS